MGRHRKKSERGGKVRKQKHVDNPHPAVDERLGLTGTVCQSCNARNPEDAESCRKCGGDVRQRASQYSDE